MTEPARADLRLVDPETGELHGSCPDCAHLNDVVKGMEVQARQHAAMLTSLKRDLDAERLDGPDRPLIVEMFEVWKQATGHKRSMLGKDRFDLIRAALKLCSKEHGSERGQEIVRLALEGIGAFPFVVNGQRLASGTTAQRHDRIGLALDGSESIERFANLGHMARGAA